MKVKATVNFAGEICMAVGELRDVPDGIAAPLLECGYLEAVESPDAASSADTWSEPKKKRGKKES